MCDELVRQEVEEFFQTLTPSELKYYNILDDNILDTMLYMRGIYDEKRLVGIGGISKWHGIFPHTFYMVKSDYQGQRHGDWLAKENVGFAKRRLHILLTVVDKENIKAVKLALRNGFKVVGEDNNKYYCYLPLGFWDWFSTLAIKI